MTTKTKLKPILLIIFGANGDLTWRKLMPALYNLFLDKVLPEKFAIIGVDGKATELEKWHEHLKSGVNQFSRRNQNDYEQWTAFVQQLISYQCSDFNDKTTYDKLAQILVGQEQEWGETGIKLFYLATPPSIVSSIVRNLGSANLVSNHQESRVVVEKPFGRDLESARSLNQDLLTVLDESQIFRIDHYLGKETVQNILALRFANAMFEPVWNRHYIDHVQITVAEQVGVEHRGDYYEHSGALRDMIQNHLLQVMSLIAMEPPIAFNADEIRARKVDVLRAIRPLELDNLHQCVTRGQYGKGLMEGEQVPSYVNEQDVAKNSSTETFAAMKLFVDNWRWQDVPFYLRTGKRLPKKLSQIIIQFRPVPHQSFPASTNPDWSPNRIQIDIQPDEAIRLCFQAKLPGASMRLSTQEMRFNYKEAFQNSSPEAYETLLQDAMEGDATLFMRADQVESAWEVVQPVLDAWSTAQSNFPNYAAGTWGPESAEMLIQQDGRNWL